MSDEEKVNALKNEGNTALAANDFNRAIELYTEAIALAPTNHILYSNRSAAYASARKFDDALKDGDKTIELSPHWVKGYGRKAFALFQLGSLEEAIATYEAGLKIEPDNAQLKQGLADVEASLRSSFSDAGNWLGQIFQGDILTKLKADPSTAPFLEDPEFVKTLLEIQSNPSTLSRHMEDKRMASVLGVLMGVSQKYSPPPEKKPKEEKKSTSSQI